MAAFKEEELLFSRKYGAFSFLNGASDYSFVVNDYLNGTSDLSFEVSDYSFITSDLSFIVSD